MQGICAGEHAYTLHFLEVAARRAMHVLQEAPQIHPGASADCCRLTRCLFGRLLQTRWLCAGLNASAMMGSCALIEVHAAPQVVEKQTFELPSLGEAWLIAQIAAVRVENRQYAVIAIAASDGLALGELQVCPSPTSVVGTVPCHLQV